MGVDRRGAVVLRLALAAFVLAWLFDVLGLRSVVPIWLPFLIALGLEAQFFLAARRPPAAAAGRGPSRLPQAADRERYGYADEPGELLLVREGGEELWIPYAGETGEELDALVAGARARAPRAEEVRAAPEPAGRRPLRRFLLGLGVIAALAAIVWLVGRGGWDGLERDTRAAAVGRFSAEASRIVGRPVTIHCDEAGEHVGVVQHADGVAAVGGDVAYLTPERCYDLYRLAFAGDVSFSRTARALAVLAHESWHLRGLRNEARTECHALQSGVELGRRLGLSVETARRMMRQQLAENALHAGRSSAYVVPAGCRDGGELDLYPARSGFP